MQHEPAGYEENMLVTTTINKEIVMLHRISPAVCLLVRFLFLHEYNNSMENTLNDAFQQDAML